MDTANSSHTDKILRGLRHIGSAQLLTQVVTWGLTAVTTRILTPRDYGLIATAGMFTIFAQLLLDGGLTQVLVSQKELPKRMQGAAITAVFLASTMLGAMIFIVSPLVATFFRNPPLQSILEVSAFYLPLTAIGFAPGVLISKRMLFKRIAGIQLAAGIYQGVATLALAYAGAAYWALIVGNFLGMGLRVILLWVTLDDRPVPNLQLHELRPVLRSGVHMIGQRLSYFAINNLDIFLLSQFRDPTALGPYSVSRTLALTAVDKISSVTGRVSVPAFAARTETKDQLRGLVTVISITATLVFPLFWTLAVVSQLALPMVFGARWLKLVAPFAAFASVLPLRTIYSLLNSSLIGTGRTGLTLKNTLTWLAFLTPAVLLGVTKGADGVAIGWAAVFPFVFFIAMRRTSKVFSAPLTALIEPLVKPAICAGISACAAEGILLALTNHAPALLILAIQSASAIVCYPTLLRFLGQLQYEQTLSFVRRIAQF